MPQRTSQAISRVLPLDEIVAAGGGCCALASKLGVTASAISQWRGQVPAHRAIEVAEYTGMPAGRIRPDLWGVETLRRVQVAHLKGRVHDAS